MSAAAAWSYTAKATVWPLLSRADWSGVKAWGAPVTFDCDYSAESVRLTDDRGIEFTTRALFFTERADVKQGDMVLIGVSALADPVAAGAFEVRAVNRWGDTLDRAADDFRIAT